MLNISFSTFIHLSNSNGIHCILTTVYVGIHCTIYTLKFIQVLPLVTVYGHIRKVIYYILFFFFRVYTVTQVVKAMRN